MKKLTRTFINSYIAIWFAYSIVSLLLSVTKAIENTCIIRVANYQNVPTGFQ